MTEIDEVAESLVLRNAEVREAIERGRRAAERGDVPARYAAIRDAHLAAYKAIRDHGQGTRVASMVQNAVEDIAEAQTEPR